MMAGHAPRNALPSASFGNIPATCLSVWIRSHIGTKQPPNCSTPKKYIVVYVKGFGVAGFAWRAKYHASHGTTVETHGTPLVSHTWATGLVVSGVELVRMRSAWLWLISSLATSDARLGSDWVSLTTTVTSKVVLPALKPFA